MKSFQGDLLDHIGFLNKDNPSVKGKLLAFILYCKKVPFSRSWRSNNASN